MPTPAELLFEDFYNYRFDSAKARIEEDPELVNATDPILGEHILETALCMNNQELIMFILTHPQMNFFYVNPENGQTIFDVVTDREFINVNAIKLAYKKPEQLINNDRLCYELVMKHTEHAREVLAKSPNPTTKAHLTKVTKLKTLEEAGELVLQITIEQAKSSVDLRKALVLYGIKKDDDVLFERLAQEGLKPSSLIGKDGEKLLPRSLLKSFNTKLTTWFDAKLQQSLASITQNENSFYNRVKVAENIQDNLRNLEIQYNVERTNATVKYAETNLDRAIDVGRRG